MLIHPLDQLEAKGLSDLDNKWTLADVSTREDVPIVLELQRALTLHHISLCGNFVIWEAWSKIQKFILPYTLSLGAKM